MKSIPTLSVYGAGKVGKTLARLWADKKLVTISEVFCQDIHSATKAVNFIGAGCARGKSDKTHAADIWLLTCPDAYLELAAKKLSDNSALQKSTVLLHCSGNSSSQLIAKFGYAASVHPVHSFANPEASLTQFGGSYCAAEGHELAIARVKPLFIGIGGQWLSIDGNEKHLYHAATVTASNHLVTLLDQAQRLAQSAGLSEDESRALLKPLAQHSLNNLFNDGAQASLTGPISRGDTATVESHLAALANFCDGTQDLDLYHALARATLKIAEKQEQSPSRLTALKALLAS